jgi:transcriptional regulator with GAF, ATPase, and Fis domain
MRTGEVQVLNVDAQGGDRWEELAAECGFESVAAVPLQHDGTVYGVLLVHAVRAGAFSAREREEFDVLGRTIGVVVNAIKSHELLFAVGVTELELRVGETELPLGPVARDAAQDEGVLDRSEIFLRDGGLLVPLVASGLSPQVR